MIMEIKRKVNSVRLTLTDREIIIPFNRQRVPARGKSEYERIFI